MRQSLWLGLLMLQTGALFGQTFRQSRQDDDFSSLRDSVNLSWYEQVKFTPLTKSGTNYLSAGGEIRYQYFRFENEEWGDAPDDNDGFILNRLLFHGDWHVNKRLRFFAQLQSSIAVGRVDPPSPVELNELELHQIFTDYQFIQQRTKSLTLRIGRQELAYGSSRLISVREGPNNRQSFDGGKLFYKSDKFKADVFYTTYVAARGGIFNDDFLKNDVEFGGAYSTFSHVPVVHNLDLYYLVQKRTNATWNDVKGKELRHSIGTRLWKSKGRWTYDLEGVVQFGDLNHQPVHAWTMSSNMSYRLAEKDNAWQVGLKTEFISGDSKQGDGRIESFNPLYPRGAYFGYAALIGPSNLFDVHPSINFPLTEAWDLFIDYDLFWRYSGHDGIYNPGARSIYPAGDTDDRFIGHQISGSLEFVPSHYFNMRAETTWFKAGTYLKDVGSGKDIFYIGITTTLKF